MQYNISQLNSSEINNLRNLLNLFGEVFAEPDTYQNNQPSDDYLKKLLKRDTFIALVASQENKIIGGLTAYVFDKFEQERREIYIYDLAVLSLYRRQKVATHLILHLREIACQLDSHVIFVQADQGDTPAICLYESLGIKENIYHFDIKVNK